MVPKFPLSSEKVGMLSSESEFVFFLVMLIFSY